MSRQKSWCWWSLGRKLWRQSFRDAWPLRNWELKSTFYSISRAKSPAKCILPLCNVLFREVASDEEALWKGSGHLSCTGSSSYLVPFQRLPLLISMLYSMLLLPVFITVLRNLNMPSCRLQLCDKNCVQFKVRSFTREDDLMMTFSCEETGLHTYCWWPALLLCSLLYFFHFSGDCNYTKCIW